MNLMELVATLSLDASKFVEGINKSKQNMGGLNAASVAIGNMISQGFNTAVGAVKDFAGYVLDSGQSFESTMSKVEAISGATGQDLVDLTNKAQEMGAKTKFSATESAEAFTYMAMAGWKTEDMLNGIEGIMSLAAASGEDLAATSDIVTDALTAFGLTADKAGHFSDVLAAASSNANTNVAMMGESFKFVAPLAGTMGYSVEDVAAALGLMANAGIKSAMGGTALRTMMMNLMNPTDKVEAALKTLNITIDDGNGNMLSLRTIMDQLRSSFGTLSMDTGTFAKEQEKLDKQLADGTITQKEYDKAMEDLILRTFGAEEAMKAQYAATIVGKGGLSGLLAIVNASEEDYNKLFAAVDNCSQMFVKTIDGAIIPMSQALAENKQWTEEYSGSAQAMAAIMQNNLGGAITILQSNLEGLAITFYNGIKGTATTAVEGLQNAVVKVTDKVREWLNNDSTQERLAQITDKIQLLIDKLIANLDPILDGVIALFDKLVDVIIYAIEHFDEIAAVVGTVVTAFLAFKAVTTALNIATLITNPVGLAITAFGGLIAILQSAGVTMDDVKAVFVAAWNGIKSAWEGAKSFFSGIAQSISSTFKQVGEGIHQTMSDAFQKVKGVWEAAQPMFKTIGDGIVTALKPVTATLVEIFKQAWETIKSVWQVAGSFFKLVWESIKTVFAVVKGVLTGDFSDAYKGVQNIWEAAGGFFESIWNAIKTVFSVVPNVLSTFFRNAWESIKTIWSVVVNYFKTIFSGIQQAFSSVPSVISGIFTNAWNAVRNAWSGVGSFFQGVKQTISNTLGNMWSDARKWGSDMIDGFKSGIEAAKNGLKSAAEGVAKTVKNIFHFSRPDEGPLRDYETWMPDFLKGMATGIEQNAWRIQKASLKAASSMASAFETGIGNGYSGSQNAMDNGNNGVNNYTISININGGQYSDENSLAEKISFELQNMLDRRRAVFA